MRRPKQEEAKEKREEYLNKIFHYNLFIKFS